MANIDVDPMNGDKRPCGTGIYRLNSILFDAISILVDPFLEVHCHCEYPNARGCDLSDDKCW